MTMNRQSCNSNDSKNALPKWKILRIPYTYADTFCLDDLNFLTNMNQLIDICVKSAGRICSLYKKHYHIY